MKPQFKQTVVIAPASTTNGATATGLVDCLNADWLTLDVITSTSDSTSNNPSVLKLAECDTSNGSFSDITAFVGDGTGGFTVPAAVTSGDWGVKFNVNLIGRKRYLQLSVSPTTTQTVTAIANLRLNESAVNTTRANVKALVEG